MSRKVIYFTNVPTPYKTGMLDAIDSKLPDFSVCYLAEIDHIRKWSGVLDGAAHRYEFLRSSRLKLRRLETEQYFSWSVIARCLQRELKAAVFAPYSQVTFWAAFLVCRMRGVRTVIWYESHGGSSIAPGTIQMFGRVAKRAILRAADAVVVPGRMARADAIRMGVSTDRIHVAPHSVDSAKFQVLDSSTASKLQPEAFRQIASKYDRVIVYVGQAVPRKNTAMLVSAFGDVRKQLDSTCLVLIGSSTSGAKCTGADVFELPFVDASSLAGILNSASLLVLPSKHEVWGLVVNEAVSCGVPVIVSEACGSHELVEEGVTGFTFDPTEQGSLCQALLKWNEAPELDRQRIRAHAVQRYSFVHMADGFVEALVPEYAARTRVGSIRSADCGEQ